MFLMLHNMILHKLLIFDQVIPVLMAFKANIKIYSNIVTFLI